MNEHPFIRLQGERCLRALKNSEAILEAGLSLVKVFGPFDSIINAFPTARSREELSRMPERILAERFSHLATVIRFIPGVRALTWRRIRAHRAPGRLYSFLASKP